MIDIYSDLVATHLNLVFTNDVTEEDVFEQDVKAVIDYSRRLLALLQMQSPKNPKKIKDTENIIYELAEVCPYEANNTAQNLVVEQGALGIDRLMGQCETPFVSINAEQF